MGFTENTEISFLGLPRFATVVVAVTIYLISSVGCVYTNKWLLSNVGVCHGFIPLVQQMIGIVFVRSLVYITTLFGIGETEDSQKKKPEKEIVANNSSIFNRLWMRYKHIWPASFCFSSTIVLNNACLSMAKLSTYSVAKSTTLIWNVIFQYILLKVKLPLSTILSCFLIISGVAVGSLDTSTLSPLALIAGCLSSIFQSLFNTCIGVALPKTSNDTSEVLVRNQELSSIFLVIYIIVSKELENLIRFSPCFDLSSNLFLSCWITFFLTTAFAAGVNKFTFMVIGLTEPSTFSVIGFTKSGIQIAGGWFIYKDPASIKSVTSVILTLSGSLIYGITRGTVGNNSSKEEKEQIRRLTRCSAASVGDIDIPQINSEAKEGGTNVNSLSLTTEKEKLIQSKV
ncbi:hypothetical protein FG386_003134 [Cryptosporidium ryanae]|uniref:uncharacterized protein n=1 Tax=Cryptosporidium ryanae TaxID=515981 RepID=UPI00351A63A5|nr:hypothetical protein FG386_003134 [Cryptosporidium ryanae]